MRKILMCAVMLMLLSSVVWADESTINPRTLTVMNRERFLKGWQAYPVQPVTVKVYNRPDSNKMLKERFLRPESLNPPALRVIESRPGGLYGGQVHLTPYWKNSVAWGRVTRGARGNPVR